MTNYARMYRFGITPWERYGTAAAASIARLLDREEIEGSCPLVSSVASRRARRHPGTGDTVALRGTLLGAETLDIQRRLLERGHHHCVISAS